MAAGVCDRCNAVTAVCGDSGGSWAVNGRVLFALLELAEARQSSSPSLDLAFASHLSLLSAGCTSAASLLSAEVHLLPADVLLTNKQLGQQHVGRALTPHIARHTEAVQSQLEALPADRTPLPPSSTTALPALLSSAADLSVSLLSSFHTFHATHIAPHLPSLKPPPPSAALLASSVSALAPVRSSVSSQLQYTNTLYGLAELSGVCGECIVAKQATLGEASWLSSEQLQSG